MNIWQKILLFFGHKGAWAKEVFEAAKKETKFEETKKKSPFADKIVIVVGYESGTTLYGDILVFADANGGVDIASSIVKNIICSRGWAIHDLDEYVLTFEFENLRIFGSGDDPGEVETFWMGCRKPGIKSPESAQRRQ
ncbi:MAG: hypothetical protein Q8Q17_02935 [bacterium]|nr:hypothetical protein [bacterium]